MRIEGQDKGAATRKRATRAMVRGLFVSSLLAGAALPGATATPASAETGRTAFNIPAQSLSGALLRYSQATGVQLFFGADLVRGRNSGGAKGPLTPTAALTRILAGSGLAYRNEGGTIAIYDPAAITGSIEATGGTVVLDTVTVEGEGDGGAGVSGFVATRSSAGTKTGAPLVETPQSISVVTRKQIEAQNAQSVTEILRYVPGVTVETYGVDPKGYDWVFIRGFNAQSTSDYRDGLRQIASSYSFFRTEPYDLDRVEVLRGPSSSLYGQSDAGGIINRVTKKPTATPVREVEVEYGSFGRVQGAFDVGGPANEDASLRYRLVGVARESNTQYSYGGADVGDDRLFLAPSIAYVPDADTSLLIQADILRDRSGGTVLYYTPTDTLIGDPDFNQSTQEQATIGYQFEHRFNDTFTLRQNLRYGHVDFVLDNLLIAGSNAAGLTRVARNFDETLDAFTVDNQGLLNFETGRVGHEVLFGLDYAYSDADVKRFTGAAPGLNPYAPVYGAPIRNPSTPLVRYTEEASQLGLYGQDQVKLTDRLIATLGGRYDWIDVTTDNALTRTTTKLEDGAFSGRAGLTYLLPQGFAPYVSYSEAFVPNLGVSAPANGSETFDPSSSRQWEGGVKYEPTAFTGLFTLALFDITKTNVLTTDLANPGFSVATGEVRSRGLELEGKVNLATGWDLTASYSYTDAEVTQSNSGNVGKRPILVPEHQASGWLNYEFQDGALAGLGLGGGLRYVGPSYGNAANTLEVEGRTLVDAGVSYTYGNVKAQVNATNLFDKRYFTTCSSTIDCYEGTRRSVIARVKTSF
ncbi:TonB-dependent siderophore receptor [Aureimonas sp. ME7]|uniref:TonB-dependent siderophore receptor n=1 Tax=Aureimonas sp. ME7 TaxID=2744252 RepID=UPI001AEEEC9F|nr:TonB-dependent siderophore receptor [Aureimonas sp. ME7]